MTTSGVLLTDDEIVCVGLSESQYWPGLLPTVSEVGSIRATASMRGARSLLVRDLAHFNAERLVVDNAIQAQIKAVLDADAIVGMHRATRAHVTFYRGEGRLYALPAFGDAVVDSVNALGVHRFQRTKVGESIAAVRDAVDSTVDESPDAEAPDVGLFVYSSLRVGATALWAGSGELVRGVLERTEPGHRIGLGSQEAIDRDTATALLNSMIGISP